MSETYSAPSDELMKLLKEVFEYSMTNVHVSFPGVVESYDPKTRRADIKPSIKKRLPNGEFLELPVLPDVPVKFPGSKKYTIHWPLEKGDEVEVRVSERSTDVWRGKGGKGIEDEDPRRFALNDCFCSPGLQPIEFIAVEEDGLNIVHKTNYDGDFISHLIMDDDKIEVKYKEKADVLIEDDHITAKTEKCSAEMTKDVITAKNSRNTFKLDDAITLVTSQTGLIEIGNAIATLGGLFDDLCTALEGHHSEGAPASHNSQLWATTNITPLKAIAAQVLKK